MTGVAAGSVACHRKQNHTGTSLVLNILAKEISFLKNHVKMYGRSCTIIIQNNE